MNDIVGEVELESTKGWPRSLAVGETGYASSHQCDEERDRDVSIIPHQRPNAGIKPSREAASA